MQFLAGRLHLFLRCLHFLAQALYFLFCLCQRLFQVQFALGPARAAFARFDSHFRGRRNIGDDQHRHAAQRRRFLNREYGQIDQLRAAIVAYPQIAADHAFATAQCSGQRQRNFLTQVVAGHRVNIPIHLAGRRFQIFAGAPVDVDQIATGRDQYRRRREFLEQQLVSQRLQIGRRCFRLRFHGWGGFRREMAGRELKFVGVKQAVAALEKAGLAFQWLEQIGEITDRLGAPQHQNAARFQAVVEQGQQFFL